MLIRMTFEIYSQMFNNSNSTTTNNTNVQVIQDAHCDIDSHMFRYAVYCSLPVIYI